MIRCQKVTSGNHSLRSVRRIAKSLRQFGIEMKYWVAPALLIVVTTLAWGQQQTSAPAASCTKNVSFAVAEAGQPVPAIPKFAAKWLDNKAHREHYPNLCFSQIPTASLSNYIVVFSTSESSFQGLKPSAQTYTTANQPKDASGDVASYGGTWSYAYTGVPPPPTTDTVDLKRDDKPKSVDVRAFDQTGRVVSRRTLATASSRDKLLEQVLGDILGDTSTTASKKGFVAPFSVYYVNCNVPDQPPAPGMPETASATPPPSAAPAANKPPPPPDPILEIWSTPAGADIFVDGEFVGKTPFSATVTAGEHTINLRKKDFGIWQRRIVAAPGKRKIGASLEQKVLVLQ